MAGLRNGTAQPEREADWAEAPSGRSYFFFFFAAFFFAIMSPPFRVRCLNPTAH
jgi:hypothetical protein